MSYLDWKVGDRVVRVKADWGARILYDGAELNLPHRIPMNSEILTIVSMTAGPGEAGTGRPDGVYLEFREIPLWQEDGPHRFAIRWDASCFRKVQPRKTDISIFKKLLHDAPDEVTA